MTIRVPDDDCEFRTMQIDAIETGFAIRIDDATQKIPDFDGNETDLSEYIKLFVLSNSALVVHIEIKTIAGLTMSKKKITLLQAYLANEIDTQRQTEHHKKHCDQCDCDEDDYDKADTDVIWDRWLRYYLAGVIPFFKLSPNKLRKIPLIKDEICPITHEPLTLESIKLKCGHWIGNTKSWGKIKPEKDEDGDYKKQCPMCRTLLDYNEYKYYPDE
jgi:hypothetical protein